MGHVLICGQTGSGKTFLANRELAKEKGVLILTPFPRDYAGAGTIFPDLPSALVYLRSAPYERSAVAPLPGRSGPATASIACEYIYSYPSARILAIDECHRIREGVDVPSSVHDFVCEGRHVGLSLWAISQRPVRTPIVVRSEAGRVISFRQNSKNDIRILEDYFGDDAEKARTLAPYCYLEWNGGETEIHGPDGALL